jgi:serine/threonine protein kinase
MNLKIRTINIQIKMYCDTFSDDVSLHGGVPKQYSSMKDKVFKEWEIPPWELKIFRDKKIGEGNFAIVYLAKWKETYVVAKVMKDTPKRFLYIREFDNMTKMHHPNIVQLFGYVENPFIIVMEYFPNKDLSKHRQLYSSKKKEICLDILKGLNYMHTRRPDSLIHRDIKPTNIVLSNSKTAKIVDFGLSKLLENNLFINSFDKNLNVLDTIEHTSPVGTLRYMAPELNQTNYNNKVDIYSTGILFYELYEGKRYNCNTKVFNFFWTPRIMKELIIRMTLQDPVNRPSASECIKFIENIK